MQVLKVKTLNWSEYVDALKAQFRDELFDDPMLEMKHLRHERSFVEYQCKFDELLPKCNLSRKCRRRTPSTSSSEGWNSTCKVRFDCNEYRNSMRPMH